MTFYIFEEIDKETDRPYWAAYRNADRTGYLCLSIDSAERCEAKARCHDTPPKLVKEVNE
jgi:hypothetical protein